MVDADRGAGLDLDILVEDGARDAAPAPMCTLSNTMLSTMRAPDSAMTHGPSTLRSTWAPLMTPPSEVIESIMVPVLPCASRTNLAGGLLSCWLKIGQSLL